MSSSRKRVVSSCIPCYTRKQKCNREYPCNHCARRRRPEECAYYPTPASQTSSPPEPRKEEERNDKERRISSRSLAVSSDWSAHTSPTASTVSSSSSSLAELFGYFEDSDNNTLALIRKFGLGEDETSHGSSPTLTSEATEEVHRIIQRMPDRQILDFLVQYFVAEINWMDQVVHLPWFLAKYQRWWAVEQMTLVMEVDFAVLILRICSYASQFLPSPSYTLDRIRGVLLPEIRNTCDEIADSLATISSSLDGRGSLIRVQHLAFFGLRCQIEGRRNGFWEALSRAIRVAQSVGIHSDAVTSRQSLDELDKEMRRRTFCNLYVWDSLLSRQLDRIPFISGCLSPENWPQMHLGGIEDGTEPTVDAPESFTERLLQARLADFWRSIGPMSGNEYDMMVAEERYEKFIREYLATLPPAFALQPNETWDKRIAKLPLQRQLLHIVIFDSLCWNFRPLLLRPIHENSLPGYKRVLLGSQKRALAVAALRVLDGVTQLHNMLGGCHTRFAGLIFSTFEAAVLLVHLCIDPQFLLDAHDGTSSDATNMKTDPLRAGMGGITRHACMQAVQSALNRLRMLAEVSSTAEVGANTLARLLNKVSAGSNEVPVSHSQEAAEITNCQLPPSSAVGDVASWLSFETSEPSPLDDFIPLSAASDIGEVGSWLSFEPADLHPRDEYIPMSAAQEFQGHWTTPMMDFSH